MSTIEHIIPFKPYFDSTEATIGSDRAFSIFTLEHSLEVSHIENSYLLYFFDGSTKVAECETAAEAVMQNKGQKILKVIKNTAVVPKDNHKII